MSTNQPTKPGHRPTAAAPGPSLSDMELMEQFDGEAADDGDDGGDGIDRPKLTGLAHMAELVRGHLEMQAEQTPDFSGDLWSKIEARLDGADAVRGGARTAISVEDRSHDNAGGGLPNADLVPGGSSSQSWQGAAKPGVWGWLAQHRAHFVTGMVSAGVVAAVALWLRPGLEPGAGRSIASAPIATAPIATIVAVVDVPPRANGSDTAMIPVALKTPTEVEALDVTDGSATVMTIADEDGETAVIWISPKDVEGL